MIRCREVVVMKCREELMCREVPAVRRAIPSSLEGRAERGGGSVTSVVRARLGRRSHGGVGRTRGGGEEAPVTMMSARPVWTNTRWDQSAMLWHPVFQEASEEEMLRAAMAMSLDQEEEVRSLGFTLIDLVYQGDQGEGGAKDSTMVEEEQALSGGAGGGGKARGAGGTR